MDPGVLWSYMVEDPEYPEEATDFGRMTLPHGDAGDRTRAAAVTSENFNLCSSGPCRMKITSVILTIAMLC